jgi:hypothetical protein
MLNVYVAIFDFTRQIEELKIGLKKIVVIHHGLIQSCLIPLFHVRQPEES